MQPAKLMAAVVLPCLVALAIPVSGQTLTAASTSALPGDPAVAAVTLDNPDPVRGFSFGLAHDGTLLNLTAITQGADVQVTNGGAGADYLFTDLDPAGQFGGVVGCVISLDPPIEEIPAGSGNELMLFHYTVDAAATPGSVSPLDFSSTLGSPPVDIVLSVAGVTVVPALVSGQVVVEAPAVEGLQCMLQDPCTCTYQLTWTNPVAYDQITVLRDGNVEATLAGGATDAMVSLPAPGGASLCVVGEAGGQTAVPTCCSVDCAAIPPPPSPTSLACVVDDVTCTVDVSWTGDPSYASLSVSLDGSVVQNLAGSATSTNVTLAGAGTFEICIDGVDDCGTPFTTVCCQGECVPPTPFVRGDGNGDGSVNISDPIWNVGYLFLSGPSICLDAQDVNDDGSVDISDPLYNLMYIFNGSTPPPAPFPGCGIDPTDNDGIGCASFPLCP